MTHQKVEEKQIGRYLLGQLGDTEQRQLEERLMTQDDLFEQVQFLEDELIDGYLKNTLSVKDRAGFEKHFLSAPERHKKLRFAEAFRSYVATANEETEKEPAKSSFWQSLLAALRTPTPVLRYGLPLVLVGVLAGGLRMGSTIQRLNTQVAQIRTEQSGWQQREQQLQQQLDEQRRRGQELEQQLTRAQAQANRPPANPLSALVAFALTPGVVRDSGTTQRLTISPDTRLVELRLELADHDYANYRVVLQDSEGSEICILNKVKPKRLGSNQFIVLPFPTNLLPSDDYSLKLSGASKTGEFDPLGSYSFRVVRR
jgi:anti-sigma factor RsiW